MDLATALTQFNPYIASPEQLAIQIAAWAEQAKQLQQNADLVAKQRQEIHLKDSKIAAFTFELAYHKRLKFGAKTEAFTSEQCDLFHESAETDLVAIEAELVQLTPAAPRTTPKPTGRKALPAELPHIEHRHEPASCTCGQCGNDLVKIGEDVSELSIAIKNRYSFPTNSDLKLTHRSHQQWLIFFTTSSRFSYFHSSQSCQHGAGVLVDSSLLQLARRGHGVVIDRAKLR